MRTAIPVEDHILPVVGLNRIVSGAEITTGGEQARKRDLEVLDDCTLCCHFLRRQREGIGAEFITMGGAFQAAWRMSLSICCGALALSSL